MASAYIPSSALWFQTSPEDLRISLFIIHYTSLIYHFCFSWTENISYNQLILRLRVSNRGYLLCDVTLACVI